MKVAAANIEDDAAKPLPQERRSGSASRMSEETYPKVLILSMNRVNAADTSSNSLLLKNLFASWPKERTAQIYSGGNNGDPGYFGAYYEVSASDRRFGTTFFRLKRRELEFSAATRGATERIPGFSPAQWTRGSARALLLRAGLYELIFSLRISQQMAAFVKEFSPDAIFAQGYSLGFAWLPVAIRKLTGSPICFHTSDDWPKNLYQSRGMSCLMQALVGRQARRLITNCAVCFGFSPAMCAEYQRRYGKEFHLLMNGDDQRRFRQARPVSRADSAETRIVYAGSLGHQRWQSLLDLCEAVGDLRGRGYQIGIYAYVLSLPPDIHPRLQRFDYLHLPDHPKHEDLPSHLKAADILFLPESFDEAEARAIQFSVSSKAQLYMMSERPVLVYSHGLTGVSRYAAAQGWALVQNRRDRTRLTGALLRLMTDQSLRDKLVRRATEVAKLNHDRQAITAAFARKLRTIVGRGAA